ncbi:hypothetical protein LCGC14_0975640 [marine sediment metagenome]|uniref:Uncharacterized protein n=1 Tax=marine sediment metagenome TaxID=412755 RepID=A0A0F9NA79_9ZZZZ
MTVEMQQHSTFILPGSPVSHNLCSPHVDGCECGPDQETRDQMWCNPYSVVGYCPTEGEGDECTADRSRLIRVLTGGGGFTHALKEESSG